MIDETIIDRMAEKLLTRLEQRVNEGFNRLSSPESILKLIKLTADAKDAVRYLATDERTEDIDFDDLRQKINYELKILRGIEHDKISTIEPQRGGKQDDNAPDDNKEKRDNRANKRSDGNTSGVEWNNWNA